MKHQDLLKIDIRFLFSRYGRAAALRAISEALNLTDEELQEELRKLVESVPSRKKKPKVFTVEDLKVIPQESLECLLVLDARYENRTFLPELRDANRFLERYGPRAPRIKSRGAGKRRIFEILVRFDPLDLKLLSNAKEVGSGFSSLGLISDQILNRNNER